MAATAMPIVEPEPPQQVAQLVEPDVPVGGAAQHFLKDLFVTRHREKSIEIGAPVVQLTKV